MMKFENLFSVLLLYFSERFTFVVSKHDHAKDKKAQRIGVEPNDA